MIRKSTNILLSRTLSGSVTVLLKQPSLSLLQLIQIAVNMTYLERSCDYLEEFISNTTGSVPLPHYQTRTVISPYHCRILCCSAEKDSVHAARLQGTAMFKDARNEAEGRIYSQINEKVDNFFELGKPHPRRLSICILEEVCLLPTTDPIVLAEYDWTAADSTGVPSDYVTDLITFLGSTFLSFSHLPVSHLCHSLAHIIPVAYDTYYLHCAAV